MDKTPNKSQSSLLGIFINILLPVLILDYCSAGPANPLERPEGENFWHIGPVWALVIALSLPLVYGIRSLVVSRKFDLMSVVGMAGVLLTGVISIFVIGPEGRIHSATPWLFAGKEALIPLILAAAVVVSRSAGTPLLNMFIYTPELFDVRRIEQTVAANGEERAYQKLLANSSWILAGTLVASSIGNFFLSLSFMSSVIQQPEAEQQVAYNAAIGSITWWGFLIIGIPILAALVFIMTRLIKRLGRLTASRGTNSFSNNPQTMRLHTSCILAAAIALHAAWADTPRFDRVFGSHMVLPHGKNIPVSGTAAPNREITVTFGNTALKTKTDSKGKWSVTLPPMPPCATGQTLAAVQNGDSAKLEDVLVGEVWLASGQSNMLFRLNQTTTAKEDIAASGDDQLRLLNNVPQAHTNNAPYSAKDFDAVTTDNFYKGQWAASSPATSGPMTAVGYYFGKKLREGLGIPVGIIHSSLGGSEIAAWIPRQVINANNSFRTLRGNHWLDSPLISDWVRGRARKNISPRLNQGSPDHPYKPAFLYESGIAWTTALPITGVIWYQGESDAEIIDNAQNSMLLKTMISSWEKSFP